MKIVWKQLSVFHSGLCGPILFKPWHLSPWSVPLYLRLDRIKLWDTGLSVSRTLLWPRYIPEWDQLLHLWRKLDRSGLLYRYYLFTDYVMQYMAWFGIGRLIWKPQNIFSFQVYIQFWNYQCGLWLLHPTVGNWIITLGNGLCSDMLPTLGAVRYTNVYVSSLISLLWVTFWSRQYFLWPWRTYCVCSYTLLSPCDACK